MEMNKLVILSKLVLFSDDNILYPDNLNIVDKFIEENIEVAILGSQYNIQRLISQIPDSYRETINFCSRQDRGLKTKITELSKNGFLISVLGCVDQDALFAFHCKIPLFNPQIMVRNDLVIESKVSSYGLPISNFQDIINCYKAFDINKNNYFRFDENENFSVISINNANTFGANRDKEEIRIKRIFETNLKANKGNYEQKILLYLLFQLINKVLSDKMFDSVDFWGTFPSSKVSNIETSASFLKEAVRVIVGGNPRSSKGVVPEIFIRHTDMQSKHTNRKRLNNKCDGDFDTLILNPLLKDKIQGKCICIIDDYITNGYSAEATKHILLQAGAQQVIFLSMGKFGTKYFKTNYKLTGDVSEANYNHILLNESQLERYSAEVSYDSYNDIGILNFGEIL